MKIFKKIILSFVCLIPLVFLTIGCDFNTTTSTSHIVSFQKTKSNGLVDTYTITYSDGKKTTFEVKNGEAGANGKDGENATISVDDLFEKYKEVYGEISYDEFLTKYISAPTLDNSKVINSCLRSVVKIYSEFYTTTQDFFSRTKNTSISCGSGVIYQINQEESYIITNYHVIYNANANDDNNGKFARQIHAFPYGVETDIVEESNKVNGYKVYNYGENALEMEIIGGSISCDLAILKVSTNALRTISPSAVAVEIAESYHVGEIAIAIGNPENAGISATEGIISVDNEYIAISSIDGTKRAYRSIRIDTATYSGSSGGGLFNSKGKLIGITNAGSVSDQNINYAVPLGIVKSIVPSILHYASPTNTNAKKVQFGFVMDSENSKYIYDPITEIGKIVEDILIDEVYENSICEEWEMQVGDKITKIILNDTTYAIEREFNIFDLAVGMRIGDTVQFVFERNNSTLTTAVHTIVENDLVVVA